MYDDNISDMQQGAAEILLVTCQCKVGPGSNREELTASICFPLCLRTRALLQLAFGIYLQQ
jgi:hypothetical protein